MCTCVHKILKILFHCFPSPSFHFIKNLTPEKNLNSSVTQSELFKGKSQTEAFIERGQRLRFSRKDQTFEFNKLFIVWLLKKPAKRNKTT